MNCSSSKSDWLPNWNDASHRTDTQQTLNLPENASYDELKLRYDQISEILDPVLVNNPELAEIVRKAQEKVDHAYAFVEKTYPEKQVHELPENDHEETTTEKDTPDSSSSKAKAETKEQAGTSNTLGKPSIFDVLLLKLRNLASKDPAPFTTDWWALNEATLNGLLVTSIVLMFVIVLVVPSGGGGNVPNSSSTLSSISASTTTSTGGTEYQNDDRLDIDLAGDFDSKGPAPRPVNRRQATRFIFNYYSILKRNAFQTAFGNWNPDVYHTWSNFAETLTRNSYVFLPADYKELPLDAVWLNSATPDQTEIVYQAKWFSGKPGNRLLTLRFVNGSWRIESDSAVGQMSPALKPDIVIRNYFSYIANSDFNAAYDLLDDTYRQKHPLDEWIKRYQPLSFSKSDIDGKYFSTEFLPPDQSPDLANLRSATPSVNASPLDDSFTLINNNGVWKIFAISESASGSSPTPFQFTPSNTKPSPMESTQPGLQKLFQKLNMSNSEAASGDRQRLKTVGYRPDLPTSFFDPIAGFLLQLIMPFVLIAILLGSFGVMSGQQFNKLVTPFFELVFTAFGLILSSMAKLIPPLFHVSSKAVAWVFSRFITTIKSSKTAQVNLPPPQAASQPSVSTYSSTASTADLLNSLSPDAKPQVPPSKPSAPPPQKPAPPPDKPAPDKAPQTKSPSNPYDEPPDINIIEK